MVTYGDVVVKCDLSYHLRAYFPDGIVYHKKWTHGIGLGLRLHAGANGDQTGGHMKLQTNWQFWLTAEARDKNDLWILLCKRQYSFIRAGETSGWPK
ncbi:MAG TPA: hypothetical protein VNE38_09950 [Ktedonobacteraceae bacterium]|nr:hypothetical protein [Ktedonobacteraceae bacterium]